MRQNSDVTWGARPAPIARDGSGVAPASTAHVDPRHDSGVDVLRRAATLAGQPAVDRLALRTSVVGTCESCGDPAILLVLEGYSQSRPVRRAFCANHAQFAGNRLRPRTEAEPRPRRGSAAIAIGLGALTLTLIAMLGDRMPSTHAGFGIAQAVGLAVGAFCVVLGGVLRLDVVSIGGALLAGMSLLADFAGGGRSAGFGWRQQLVLAVGFLLLGLAGLLAWRSIQARRERNPLLPFARLEEEHSA